MFFKNLIKLFAVLLLLAAQQELVIAAGQVSIGMDSDMSRPTYGMHGQSSSQVTYNDQNGINLKGAIQDILGPPIKMATGFNNMLTGSGMADVGHSLKANGAVLGFDSKLLEAAGGAHLLKGGFLLGKTGAKTAAATAAKGPVGKKISSIIEMPVKVVAMKDLATGKAMAGMGKVKGAEALAMKTKGATMIKAGETLKAQGLNQVLQGANEGFQNIGNAVQQTAGNAATAFKLLPIILDMPMQQQQQQQPIQQQVQQETKTSGQYAYPTAHQMNGGSLFGGLGSLIPGLGKSSSSMDPFAPFIGSSQTSPFNLFGANNHAHSYAAVLNNTNPLTNLLMNSGSGGILYPIMSGPLGQSLSGKQAGTSGGFLGPIPGLGSTPIGQGESYTYSLLPGVTVRESVSSQMPEFAQTGHLGKSRGVQETKGGQVEQQNKV